MIPITPSLQVMNVDGCIGALFLDLLSSSSMFAKVSCIGLLVAFRHHCHQTCHRFYQLQNIAPSFACHTCCSHLLEWRVDESKVAITTAVHTI